MSLNISGSEHWTTFE